MEENNQNNLILFYFILSCPTLKYNIPRNKFNKRFKYLHQAKKISEVKKKKKKKE